MNILIIMFIAVRFMKVRTADGVFYFNTKFTFLSV